MLTRKYHPRTYTQNIFPFKLNYWLNEHSFRSHSSVFPTLTHTHIEKPLTPHRITHLASSNITINLLSYTHILQVYKHSLEHIYRNRHRHIIHRATNTTTTTTAAHDIDKISSFNELAFRRCRRHIVVVVIVAFLVWRCVYV